MRVTATVLFFMAVPGLALAQGDRTGSWEWSVGATYQESNSLSSEQGTSLDVESEYGIGFNLGYHLTNNLTVGFDMDFIKPDYRAVLVDDTVSPAETTIIEHRFSQWNGRFKGTYSLGNGPLQPFIEAGLGWTFVDSNVADGDPIVGCWWHPWWGYICDGFYSTFSDTTFTYGAGLGLRYRFAGGTFLKAGYNVWQLDSIGPTGDASISGARLEFGWGF